MRRGLFALVFVAVAAFASAATPPEPTTPTTPAAPVADAAPSAAAAAPAEPTAPTLSPGAPSTRPAAPLAFTDAAEEKRFRELVLQLRCVMCQNQSLADSDAMIARDLRAQVLALMRSGKSDDQIKAYLVERYTDFVLYRPQVRPMTWLLWFGPVLLLIGGAWWIAGIVRRQSPPSAPPPDDQEW
jgi:cytochrome c-type biogenesis protein CcmH